MTTHLIVPGLGGSGAAHWQTWLEGELPESVRATQDDWTTPDLAKWSARLRNILARNPDQHIIIAHSFGVLAAVQAAADRPGQIAGLLLVAPAEPERLGLDPATLRVSIPVPSIVVSSSSDRWMSEHSARQWADVWGARHISLGDAGHINSESGFGPWPLAPRLIRQIEHDARDHLAATATTHPRGRIVDAAQVLRESGWTVSRRPEARLKHHTAAQEFTAMRHGL